MKTDRDSANAVAVRTLVAFSVITGGVLILMFLYSIRSVLLQLIIALVLAIALDPLVRLLIKRGLRRTTAAILALVATTVVLIGLIGAIASPLITQGDDLIRSAPQLLDKATSSPPIKSLDNQFHIVDKISDISKQAPGLLSAGKAPVLGVVGSVFSAVSSFFVILFFVLFMLIEGPTAWGQFINLLGRRQGAFVDNVAKKIRIAVGGFVNGNLFISLIAGVVTLITLLIARVPYALPLAALTAIFDLIPLVGATIATVVIALVALSKGLITAIIVVGIMLLYQFVEGNIIQPVVYGKAVRLSQLLIIVASVIGALLGGIIGVLLAIPVAAAVQIIIVEVLRANGVALEPEVSKSVEA